MVLLHDFVIPSRMLTYSYCTIVLSHVAGTLHYVVLHNVLPFRLVRSGDLCYST